MILVTKFSLGDTVFVFGEADEIIAATVGCVSVEVIKGKCEEHYQCYETGISGETGCGIQYTLGESLFYTRADAEKALEERSE